MVFYISIRMHISKKEFLGYAYSQTLRIKPKRAKDQVLTVHPPCLVEKPAHLLHDVGVLTSIREVQKFCGKIHGVLKSDLDEMAGDGEIG